MPRRSTAWRDAEALWITAAGWGMAAERAVGKAWIVTPDRVASPQQVLDYPIEPPSSQRKRNPLAAFVPLFIKNIIKDVVLYKQASRFNIRKFSSSWKGHKIQFVWQQHDLFGPPGRKLADELGVPLITFVHAPVVWESGRWGVRRPLYGLILERMEANMLRQADLVACVSQEVANKLMAMGIREDKIMVSPMAADPNLFHNFSTAQVKKDLGVANRKVVGWIGSFRLFHGLDTLMNAFAAVLKQEPDAVLMLVGDGQERSNMERMAKGLGIDSKVIFPGKQKFTSIPWYIAGFDVAVVSARKATDFHYSPLKLREYLVARKATVAPIAGEIPVKFKHNEELLLYTPGDTSDLTKKLLQLLGDPALANQLATAGRDKVMSTGTWDYELSSALARLNFAK